MTERRPCRRCGRVILIAQDRDRGTFVPLDVAAPVYRLAADGTIVRERDSYVTHFATCPHANEFSKTRKTT